MKPLPDEQYESAHIAQHPGFSLKLSAECGLYTLAVVQITLQHPELVEQEDYEPVRAGLLAVKEALIAGVALKQSKIAGVPATVDQRMIAILRKGDKPPIREE